MIKIKIKHTRLLTVFATVITTILTFSRPALAIDDGARAYWKGRDGTQVVSYQYLRLDIDASGTQQFAPGQYIYPNADIETDLFLLTWSHHLTLPLINRPSSLSLNLAGGDVDVDVNTNLIPGRFLPVNVASGSSFNQSSTGLTDPSIQLDVNLYGTPPLKGVYDQLNYEPNLTVDFAVMAAFPIGEYEDDKLVNIGQNRWYGRFALPLKYHFGPFSRGHMTSLEVIPSMWLFAENDDFIERKLENEPLGQVEAHLTHDFTPTFFASLDMLYRYGFQSKIDGVEVGDDLNIGNLGFTLNYQATDNIAIRSGYSTNAFGDDDLDNSMFRIQFVYLWHRITENAKKLKRGH
jgi:hypothetical protein